MEAPAGRGVEPDVAPPQAAIAHEVAKQEALRTFMGPWDPL